jgi:citrate synthase
MPRGSTISSNLHPPNWERAVAASEVISFGPNQLIPAERLLVKEEEVINVGNRALDILAAPPPPLHPTTADGCLINARAAALMLGVSRSTLYTYVSRQRLGRVVDPATGRSAFNAAEVAALHERTNRGRRPDRVALASLDFGLPVLPTSISTIKDGALFYRGRDAIALSRDADLEKIAALLWNSPPNRAIPAGPDDVQTSDVQPEFEVALLSWLGRQAASYRNVGVWTPRMARPHAWRILRNALAIATGRWDVDQPSHVSLARLLGLDITGQSLLRMALVLHADHELNTSTFTARCTASTAANPYAAVAAALCATMGGRHANFTGTRALIEAHGRGDVTGVAELTEFPGFAHKLYPGGDPRAICLLAVMRDIPEISATVADIDKLVASIEAAHGLRPKNDFAMATLEIAYGLPADTARTIFLISRLVGWLAHVIEQYGSPSLIRPRASYFELHCDKLT